MYLKKLQGKDKHIIEYDRAIHGVLIKAFSPEGTPELFRNITVSIEINSPGNRRIDLSRKVPIMEYGLMTSRDADNNNKYNVDVKPNAVATKGYYHWVMLNLTPDGNIPLLEDEKLIITFENTTDWELDVAYDEKTFVTNRLLTLESETLREGINVNYNVRRAHYFLGNHSTINTEGTYKYEDNTSVVKSVMENQFMAYTEDYVGTREFIGGEEGEIVADLTNQNDYYIVQLQGVNPINNVMFDELSSDLRMVKCIVQERTGDTIKPLTKNIG